MSKTVKVAPGYSNVPLYSGILNQGQSMLLTDDQFDNLPLFIQRQLQVVNNTSDDFMSSLPETSFTSTLIAAVLQKLGVALFLRWDGSTYQPSAHLADMTRMKVFVGPTDPNTVPGVLVNTNDQWFSEA